MHTYTQTNQGRSNITFMTYMSKQKYLFISFLEPPPHLNAFTTVNEVVIFLCRQVNFFCFMYLFLCLQGKSIQKLDFFVAAPLNISSMNSQRERLYWLGQK